MIVIPVLINLLPFFFHDLQISDNRNNTNENTNNESENFIDLRGSIPTLPVMCFPVTPDPGTALLISKKRKGGVTKSVDWDNDVKSDHRVVKRWVTLSHVNGVSLIICNICGKGVTVRMRREFDPYSWNNQSSGRNFTKSHISAIASKEHYEYLQAKAFAATSEDGEVYVSPKPKK